MFNLAAALILSLRSVQEQQTCCRGVRQTQLTETAEDESSRRGVHQSQHDDPYEDTLRSGNQSRSELTPFLAAFLLLFCIRRVLTIRRLPIKRILKHETRLVTCSLSSPDVKI